VVATAGEAEPKRELGPLLLYLIAASVVSLPYVQRDHEFENAPRLQHAATSAEAAGRLPD